MSKIKEPVVKNFYFPKDLATWIAEKALEEDVSESKFIRDLIKKEKAKENE